MLDLIGRMRIQRRLALGFGFVLLLATLMGLGALYVLDAIAQRTSDLYEHPFTTTNSSNDGYLAAYRIGLMMKEVARETDKARLDEHVQQIAALDAELADRLEVASEAFYGDKTFVTEIQIDHARWRAYRQETVRLAAAGAYDEAWARTTSRTGNPGIAMAEKLAGLIATSRGFAKRFYSEAQEHRRRSQAQILLAIAAMVALGLFASVAITRSISGPLDRLRESILALAEGKLETEVPHRKDQNEIGDIARSVEVFRDALAALERQRWVKGETAEILGALQKAESTEAFAAGLLSKLVPLLDGGHGAFFLHDEASSRFRWTGGYGRGAGDLREGFAQGEGLAGQAAVEKKAVVLTDVPAGYVKIASGIGEAPPRALVILPVTVGQRVLAVVEIAAFHGPSVQERALIDEVAAVIALNLEVLQRNLATRALLDKTRAQAQELERREKDLRQVNFQADTALELTRAGYWHVPLDGSGWYNSSARAAAIFGDPPRPDLRYRLDTEWSANVKAGDEAAAKTTAENFAAAVAGTIPAYDATYAYKRPIDGRVVWIHALGHVVKGPDGKPKDMFGVTQDITDFKRLEQETLAAKEVAEAATRTKSDFLANMSHEIRTPMNAVIGLAHLALKTQLSAKQRDYLSKIHNAGTSLLGIINDILDFSKIEAGRLDIERTELDLDKVMSAVTTVVGQKAHDKGLELLVSVASNVPNDLVGDPLRLGQIVINLVNNAVKFTEQGQVRVRVAVQEKTGEKVKLRFSIEDTGMGMTREQSARLFQPFVQADSSTTRKHGGTGLGLTIAKRLVELMGGQIGLESEPGVGSTFYFTAWLGLGAARGRRALLPGELSRLRVLVVDDNPAAREIISEALQGIAARVDVVSSGAEAVDAVEHHDGTDPYDVVFMDWRMPGMDGLEATARLKQHPTLRHQPHVVMVTAFGREEVREEAEKLAVDAFLLKPVTRSMLVDSLVSIFAPEGEETALASAAAREEGHRLDGARILLAEDNEINQQIAVELLEGVGARVTVAGNGRIAVEMLESSADPAAFHLVLMDMQMPEMDGHQATARIRASPRLSGLPVIAMTAHATVEERQRCLDEGMVDHISKPIDPEVLFRTVGKHYIPDPATHATSFTSAHPPPPAPSSDLPSLPGLDTADGLARVAGNRKLYRKLLTQFAHEQRDAAARVATLLVSGDRAGAERLAHTVKGVAGNLGAKEVQAVAGKLEKAIAAEKGMGTAALEALRAELERVLAQLLGPLAAALAPVADAVAPAPAAPPPPVDPARAEAAVSQLRKQLSDFDAAAAETVEANKDLLRAVLPPDALAALEKAVQGYAFDEALAQLDRAAPPRAEST